MFCVFFLFFLSSNIIIIVHMYYCFKQEEVGVGDKLVSIRLFYSFTYTFVIYF